MSSTSLRHHHVAIVVNDLKASTAWYGEHLGFDHEFDFELPGAKVSMLACGDARLELYQVEDAAPVAAERQRVDTILKTVGINHYGFAVGDLDAVVKSLTSKGVEFAMPISEVPNGSGDRFAFFYDNDRMLVELFQAAI